MSRWSLRWHFTNKSLTGASYSIKVTVSSGFTLSTSYQSLRIQLACFYVDSISALMIQLGIIDVAFLVTVLVDPWPWSVTLTLSPKWAMVITHTHTKGQRLVGLLVQKLKWKQTFLCVFFFVTTLGRICSVVSLYCYQWHWVTAKATSAVWKPEIYTLVSADEWVTCSLLYDL